MTFLPTFVTGGILVTGPSGAVPVISGLRAGQGGAQVAVPGDTLTALIDGAPATGTIRWRTGGAEIPGETGAVLAAVPDAVGQLLSVTVEGNESTAVAIVAAGVVAIAHPGAVPNPGDTVTVTFDGVPATGGEAELLRGGSLVALTAGQYSLGTGDVGQILHARQTSLPGNLSAALTVQASPAPEPVTAAGNGGSAMEGLTRSVDTADTWSTDGAAAAIAAREYRLVVDGTPGAAQGTPTLPIPQATAGQTAQPQVRAKTATSAFSAWTDAGDAFVVEADIPLVSGLPGVTGSITEGGTRSLDTADTWTLDGAPATIAAREYRLALDGTPGASQASSALAIPAASAGASAQVQLRARTAVSEWSAWTDAEAAFTVASGATAPAQFAAGGWSIADAGTGGATTFTVTTLPDDGGSAITALQYRIGAGTWTALGGTGTGARTITGFTDGVQASVTVRAVNAVGNGPESGSKTVTTTAPGAAPVIDALTLSAQEGDGDLPVTLTTADSGSFSFVLTGSASKPTVAEVRAGLDHTGSPALAAGTIAVTGAGGYSDAGAVTGITASGCYLHGVLWNGSGDSAVASAGPVNLDAGGGGSWSAPSAGAGDAAATLSAGGDQPAAPAAPTISATGDGAVTLSAA